MLQYLLDIFFPRTCACCGCVLNSSEEQICTACIADIPRTYLHRRADNAVEQRFWGKVGIEHAAAFFAYERGSRYRTAIHKMKYSNRPGIGLVLGRYAAADLVDDGAFMDVDLIVPVPLHPRKQRRRGYNQSEYIARGMAQVMDVTMDTDSVIRIVSNETQTHKNHYDRHQNVDDIFRVAHPERLRGHHVLLVDDIITTGSTIGSCAKNIIDTVGDVRVSIYAMGIAG